MQGSVGDDLTPPTGGGPMAMGGSGSGRTPASPATICNAEMYLYEFTYKRKQM